MAVNYYKRFRMEYDLRRVIATPAPISGYQFVPWHPELLEHHADVKCRSFINEMDSIVFPCLGEPHGCLQLMTEIADRDGFLPRATWLVTYNGDDLSMPRYCGTIQGLRTSPTIGSIQNVGTVPEHRGRGLATGLVIRAIQGFQAHGLRRAFLEVTARNLRAVRLYQRLGFRATRTVYKAVEAAYS
ncbi:MAG: GNAT family N-acetyltransferase [Planctomycetota bacterium]